MGSGGWAGSKGGGWFSAIPPTRYHDAGVGGRFWGHGEGGRSSLQPLPLIPRCKSVGGWGCKGAVSR